MKNMLTGKMFKKPKTEFPAYWTKEKVAKAVWEVYENPIKADEICEKSDHFKRTGIIDGLELEIVYSNKFQNLESKNLDVCNIKTFMPSEK